MKDKKASGQGIGSVDDLNVKMDRVRRAQEIYATFSQEQVDKIFKAAALAACKQRIPLAKMAAEETGMGIVEDKVIKNHYASEYIYHQYKDTKTCGLIEEDQSAGIRKIAEPMGVIAAVIPTTNPTSTVIFKALIALKTRNGIILMPPKRATQCAAEAAFVVYEAAVKAGAPEGLIAWIETPSRELSRETMQSSDLTLATGGPGMVRAAYSSGKPAIGVGAGNVPAVFHKSANVRMAVSSVLISKTFDNGMICSSEQSVIVDDAIYDAVKEEFTYRGGYFLKPAELEKVRKTMVVEGSLNTEIVGQPATKIAELAGITVPADTKVLIGEVESVEPSEEFSREKLSPMLAMYRYTTFDEAVEKADRLIREGGFGHTTSLYIDTHENKDLAKFENAMKTSRILVNTPSAQGGIGDLYNFKLAPSLTLGCGSWGGNSVSENVGVKHLLNIKTVAERRENMLWFRTPEKVYFKKGSLPVALSELKDVYDKRKAFIVTDEFLYTNNYTKPLTDKLDEMGIKHFTFFDVSSDPTLKSAKEGAKAMCDFEPDCIIAIGGGSPMDAAKIMWTLYEHPDADFHDLATRFMDIRKRIVSYPKMGEKANLVAIPTTAGTGSEVTPFAVITDEETGIKYPIADYELLPNIAIIDVGLMMGMPPSLTAAAGIDALSHSLEAYASMLASDYTDGLALTSIKNIMKYLPVAYADGNNEEAREKMANASTIAGMAFANAFLGICHSMAHKLGAFFHLPHGVANALLISEVIRFNATERPQKMGAFSQYEYPKATERYAEIASFLGLPGETNEEKTEHLIAEVNKLKENIGIEKCIKDYGIAEEDFLARLDEMVEQAFDDQCTGANPRYPLMKELKGIYLRAYYGTQAD
ncbi:MAG: bifunctional acetaldehyde-CoA/alcohol dehydrogenase [Coriobacteriia bacterium]|nr:bifunctional acetaldehyde-CoA/alcohol dehydrogenase [Coriobacteriia bacterium]MCL2870987.1 bifunctional acetaldehyde-CoA/alcohol dehydrogenase [Coriobacteriia bacterium]